MTCYCLRRSCRESVSLNNRAAFAVFLAAALGAGAVFGQGRTLWQDGGVQLCGPSAAGDPLATSDGAGGAIVVWRDTRSGPPHNSVYAQRVDPAGVPLWTEDGVLLCDSIWEGLFGVVDDGEHGAIAGWAMYGFPLVVQRVSAEGVPLWGSNGLELRPGLDSTTECPALVRDGRGGTIVVWHAYHPYRPQTETLIACRVDSAGSKKWETEVCIDTLGDTPPHVCSDDLGGVIIAWSRGNLGPVRVQRVDSVGAIRWDPAGVLVCTLAAVKAAASCVEVGQWSAVVGFYVSTGGTWHTRAQMFDSAGSRMWGLAGVPVTGTSNSSAGVVGLSADDHRQSMWFWAENRMGKDEFFAQRLDSSGSPCWDTTGVWVGTSDTADGYPFSATVDGRGGAITAWPLYRTDRNSDEYAQHVDSAGHLYWSDTGLAVCRDTNDQRRTPAVVPDGDGGAIIAWLELRWGEGSAICAQRVADGSGIEERHKPQASSRKPAATVVHGELFLEEATSRKPQAAGLWDAVGRRAAVLKSGPNDIRHLAPGVYFVREERQASSRRLQVVRKVVITR